MGEEIVELPIVRKTRGKRPQNPRTYHQSKSCFKKQNPVSEVFLVGEARVELPIVRKTRGERSLIV